MAIEQKPSFIAHAREVVSGLWLAARLALDPTTDPAWVEFRQRRSARQRMIEEGSLAQPTNMRDRVRGVLEDLKRSAYF